MSESCDTGVVSPNTKVCGMDNLYIVDGSIIPTLFTVNPQYGIMVAGEHGSDRIIADRGDCCGCLGQVNAMCPTLNSAISANTSQTSRPSAKSAASRACQQGQVYLAVSLLVGPLAFIVFS